MSRPAQTKFYDTRFPQPIFLRSFQKFGLLDRDVLVLAALLLFRAKSDPLSFSALSKELLEGIGVSEATRRNPSLSFTRNPAAITQAQKDLIRITLTGYFTFFGKGRLAAAEITMLQKTYPHFSHEKHVVNGILKEFGRFIEANNV